MAEALEKKLPAANVLTAALAGFSVGVIFVLIGSYGEQSKFIFGILGSIWCILSCLFFVSGRNSLNLILGKESYLGVELKTFIRGIVFAAFILLGSKLCLHIIRNIRT